MEDQGDERAGTLGLTEKPSGSFTQRQRADLTPTGLQSKGQSIRYVGKDCEGDKGVYLCYWCAAATEEQASVMLFVLC